MRSCRILKIHSIYDSWEFSFGGLASARKSALKHEVGMCGRSVRAFLWIRARARESEWVRKMCRASIMDTPSLLWYLINVAKRRLPSQVSIYLVVTIYWKGMERRERSHKMLDDMRCDGEWNWTSSEPTSHLSSSRTHIHFQVWQAWRLTTKGKTAWDSTKSKGGRGQKSCQSQLPH